LPASRLDENATVGALVVTLREPVRFSGVPANTVPDVVTAN
jgi:hypothetical protein